MKKSNKKSIKKTLIKTMSAVSALSITATVLPTSVLIEKVYADSNLAISNYVKTSGTVEGVEKSNKGTYKGVWSANVPMGKVLSAVENKMKDAAKGNLYPHGKDGAYNIAYVDYTVTFPENVTIVSDKIEMKNTTSMFNQNAFEKEVNGQKVRFKLHLNDEDWKSIYNEYKKRWR